MIYPAKSCLYFLFLQLMSDYSWILKKALINNHLYIDLSSCFLQNKIKIWEENVFLPIKKKLLTPQ